MIDNSAIFAFDTHFDNEGKAFLLEVFIQYNSDSTPYYYCVVDDKHKYAFAKTGDGVLIDLTLGKTELAAQIGRIIEGELS